MRQWQPESNMLVDSHCHLIGSSFKDTSPDALLVRARAAGVSGFVVVGTHLGDCPEVVALAKAHADVQATVGIHPHDAKTWEADSEARLEALAADPVVRFIGETGLDYHYDLSPRDLQQQVFRQQIQLARRVGKPLMIHTRTAAEDTLALLRDEGGREVGGVFHCFSEDLAFARQALDLGFHLSFSGIVTFKTAAAIQEVAAWAPLDRILVETDAPYLAPVPHRGRRNEPAYVVHVAAFVARLRGISFDTLADATTRNLEALCGWPTS